MLAFEHGSKLRDVSDIDESRAADPKEPLGFKRGLKHAEFFAQDMSLLTNVENNVIVTSLHPIYLVHREEHNPVGAFDFQAGQVLGSGLDILKQTHSFLADLAAIPGL